MINNSTFSRREFGSIAIAGLAYAATGKIVLNADAEDNTGMLSSPAASAARDIIASGAIGAIYFGGSSLGNCTTVSDTHKKQLLLLCEILQPGQAYATQSIAIPASAENTKCFRTLMTTLAFSSGIKIEVTSTADSINTTGCIVRGECGSIHIFEDHLTLFSNENQRQKEVCFDADDRKTQSQHNDNKYAALVHKVMHDAQKRMSA